MCIYILNYFVPVFNTEPVTADGEMRIVNMEFHEELIDPNSDLFKQYSETICDEVCAVSYSLICDILNNNHDSNHD